MENNDYKYDLNELLPEINPWFKADEKLENLLNDRLARVLKRSPDPDYFEFWKLSNLEMLLRLEHYNTTLDVVWALMIKHPLVESLTTIDQRCLLDWVITEDIVENIRRLENSRRERVFKGQDLDPKREEQYIKTISHFGQIQQKLREKVVKEVL